MTSDRQKSSLDFPGREDPPHIEVSRSDTPDVDTDSVRDHLAEIFPYVGSAEWA
ncbi:hypothetical protein KKF55_02245 [Patescibacteria group bacterium]|nr:hypothetical protein [Patescibacteria group bacterium]